MEELDVRMEDNIQMYVKEKDGGGVDWINLAQNRSRWWLL